VVWNGLFNPDRIRMMPNSSSITHREIVSLGRRLRDFFGTWDAFEIDYDWYLQPEQVLRIMMVADFSRSPWEENARRYSAVYLNSWGEMFCQRFGDGSGLQTFIAGLKRQNPGVEIGKYLRRRATSFEKDIARPKAVSFPGVKR
jgi:hypothetical protein